MLCSLTLPIFPLAALLVEKLCWENVNGNVVPSNVSEGVSIFELISRKKSYMLERFLHAFLV